MKTKTFTAAIALTGLLSFGGVVVAAEGPHDAYDLSLIHISEPTRPY